MTARKTPAAKAAPAKVADDTAAGDPDITNEGDPGVAAAEVEAHGIDPSAAEEEVLLPAEKRTKAEVAAEPDLASDDRIGLTVDPAHGDVVSYDDGRSYRVENGLIVELL